MSKRVCVLGAGIVGVTCALEIQRRGFDVTLVDRKTPGSETSFGNAGVLSDSSVLVVNNPDLAFRLPKMLLNTSTALRYDLRFVLSRLDWVTRFLLYANRRHKYHAGKALRPLLVESLRLHKQRIAEAGVEHLLAESGWLKLYRTESAFLSSAGEREFFEALGGRYTIADQEGITDLEPALKPIFSKGVLMVDTYSVTSPSELTRAYVKVFREDGGQFVQAEVDKFQSVNGGWKVVFTNLVPFEFDHLVVAAGPWSAELLETLGYKIPMAWERGYHQHLQMMGSRQLTRPIYDVEAGFVVSPQQKGLRVLTGVELTYRDAPINVGQMQAAIKSAREILPLGNALEDEAWLGRRPTLVDSLPMIGAAPKHRRLWFNFGHQHIGLSTSAGSAVILADQLENKKSLIDSTAFRPERFKL